MTYNSIALYDWSNGVIMMAVFGLICLILNYRIDFFYE